jgi:hypothetical protein
MKLLNKSYLFNDKQIEVIEKKYNAKYVFESCLRTKNGYWANFVSAIFYTEEKHPEGSNYLAVFKDADGLTYVANGLSAVEDVIFVGIEAENEVAYSRYRHDYVTHKNGAFIDGGRDYTRIGGDRLDDYNKVNFKVVDGNIQFIDYPTVPDVDYHNQEFDR